MSMATESEIIHGCFGPLSCRQILRTISHASLRLQNTELNSVGTAMGRNKHIYVLSDAGLAVDATAGKGGTWTPGRSRI